MNDKINDEWLESWSKNIKESFPEFIEKQSKRFLNEFTFIHDKKNDE